MRPTLQRLSRATLETAEGFTSQAHAATRARFVPRSTFEVSASLPKSYFLGHHRNALHDMSKILSQVNLVLELRDSRVPFSSRNPVFEASLSDRDRIIVYTKADLSFRDRKSRPEHPKADELGRYGGFKGLVDLQAPSRDLDNAQSQETGEGVHRLGLDAEVAMQGFETPVEVLAHDQSWKYMEEDPDPESEPERKSDLNPYSQRMNHETEIGGGTQVIYTSDSDKKSIRKLIAMIKQQARTIDSLTGVQVMVVGMPNVGKSSLLNTLRRESMRLGDAARHGSQPGVTRKIATPVRIIAEDIQGGIERGVFLIDTPGVFVPFVKNPIKMLKLCLVGCVKDGIVQHVTVADYLLFRLNLENPRLYSRYSEPTNDIYAFLESLATRIGKLNKGGEPNLEAAAVFFIHKWRIGELGKFVLDDATEDLVTSENDEISMHSAKKRAKAVRAERISRKIEAGRQG